VWVVVVGLVGVAVHKTPLRNSLKTAG